MKQVSAIDNDLLLPCMRHGTIWSQTLDVYGLCPARRAQHLRHLRQLIDLMYEVDSGDVIRNTGRVKASPDSFRHRRQIVTTLHRPDHFSQFGQGPIAGVAVFPCIRLFAEPACSRSSCARRSGSVSFHLWAHSVPPPTAITAAVCCCVVTSR